MIYLQFAGGIAMLIFFGDVLVRGAVALALRLGIPTLVIGLTVVAFGTSAPELVVSLKAALDGSPGIAVGNVVGSNIANVFLVLGIPALISATACTERYLDRNTYYVLAASLIFIALCFLEPLRFWHGALLFALMIAFLWELAHRNLNDRKKNNNTSDEFLEVDGVSALPKPGWLIGAFLLFGLVGLPLGATLTVKAAAEMARNWGVSEAAVGLTVVAVGTSLPELATTLVAAVRGHAALALGNVLGSNLFNILAIIGLTAMVTPVPVPETILHIDLWVMLAATLALTPFVMLQKPINRGVGVAFVLCYVAYVAIVYAPHGHQVAFVAP